MTNAIEIRGLHWKPENGFSIQGLDLTVPTGSVYGFLGPNGSGKTSTIRLFMGMAKAESGEMRVLGGGVPSDMPRILARTGYVPEKPHIHPGLTVAEAIRFHAAFYPTWDGRWAEEMQGAFHLASHARFKKLSKGERGKLLILLALAQRPELLVLDEPTDGLDPVVRRDVLAALLGYVSETGATVFISSHLVHELERFCDWVGILDDGRLLAEMPMEAFKNEIKRIRVASPPAQKEVELPFQLLGRHPSDGMAAGEIWIVRGWEDGMAGHLSNRGITVKDVVHLDLEDGFVELLRAARPGVWGGRGGGWAAPRKGARQEHDEGESDTPNAEED
ncbi:MAG: ABC transporter ATP-binding protein [Longimicrobiales bacterium]